jgi:hypothetical protein
MRLTIGGEQRPEVLPMQNLSSLPPSSYSLQGSF